MASLNFGKTPTRWSLLVPVVAAAAGLMFAISFQTSRDLGTQLRSDGRDLPSQIRDQTTRVERSAKMVKSLQQELEELRGAKAPVDSELSTLTQLAESKAPIAGEAAVTGPAVKVSLEDAKRDAATLPKGFTADDMVVHEQDVQAVVNALWAGGAEAMMIQDQRVIATTAVRCVGNTLLLQGRVYSPPFVITAIGDTGAMRRSLDNDATLKIYRQYVDALGLGYDVKTVDGDFPAYSGTLDLQYAKVTR